MARRRHTMFRNEKATQWEGGFRVPCAIRWPGVIKPGTVINDLCAHEDMLPTLLAAAGDTTVKEDLLKGKQVGDMNYKVHLDGDNLMPFLKGEEKVSPRKSFLYWTDDGDVAALRYNNWKITFLKQNAEGSMFGESLSKFSALQCCATCAWTLSSAPSTKASVTTDGGWITCSCLRPPELMSANGFRASRVPAAPEARQLQPQQCDGIHYQSCRRQVTRIMGSLFPRTRPHLTDSGAAYLGKRKTPAGRPPRVERRIS